MDTTLDVSMLDVSMLGTQISASANGGLYVSGTAGEVYMSTNNPVPLTFTFTGTLPTAVGGLFLTTDSGFNAVTTTIKVTLGDGTAIVTVGGAGNTTVTFVGFTNDVGISSLTIESGGVNTYPTVNALYVKDSAVPEPTSMLLSMFAGGMMLLRRKR